MDDPELKRLLHDIAPLSGRTNGRRYPRRLQKRIVAYCARRRAEGVSLPAVVGELGVSLPTLQCWCEEAPTAPTRFREVLCSVRAQRRCPRRSRSQEAARLGCAPSALLWPRRPRLSAMSRANDPHRRHQRPLHGGEDPAPPRTSHPRAASTPAVPSPGGAGIRYPLLDPHEGIDPPAPND